MYFNPKETGHANNVATFLEMISICSSFGQRYNPANPSLTLPQLQSLLTAVQSMMTQVREEQTALTNLTDLRSTVIKELKKFARQIVNALEALGASPAKVENAQDFVSKMNGLRLTDLPEPLPGETPEQRDSRINSPAQTGFVNIVEHFAALISIVKSEPGYQPNEPELSIDGLTAKLEELRNLNKRIADATTQLKSTKIKRFRLMYEDVTGMTEIGNAVKQYVKSVFGASSPEYKQLSKLQFRKAKS